jgi:ribonucleoside-diphosphate reductase alpha chain
MDKIAEGTWLCGDPGLQYEDTIQRWHTCPNTAPINSSNPCSEYMFIDDSACNLSSINLMKFRLDDGTFDAKALPRGVPDLHHAQEILSTTRATRPTGSRPTSHKFRRWASATRTWAACSCPRAPLRIARGRGLAASITAIMHGQLPDQRRACGPPGPLRRVRAEREPMLRVMEMHRDAVESIDPRPRPNLLAEARAVGMNAWTRGVATAIGTARSRSWRRPGTIAFMMDCDTTGIEPDIALVKYKQLAGGGMLKLVNGPCRWRCTSSAMTIRRSGA